LRINKALWIVDDWEISVVDDKQNIELNNVTRIFGVRLELRQQSAGSGKIPDSHVSGEGF